MKMRIRNTLVGFCFLIVLVHSGPAILSAPAEDSIYDIDPSHSSVAFRIRHLVSVVKGSFKQFSGQIRFDLQFQNSSVNVRIDSASIDTNQAKRDEHLKSPDFFDVKKYPEMTFKSKRVTKQIMVGELTLCGITKEITLDYVFHGIMNDLNGQKRIGFSATGVINRRDFGIVYNKEVTADVKLLGDEVPIEIEIQAVQKTKDSFQNAKKPADTSKTVTP